MTTYVGSVEDTLTEPFPLYFADGVDDLPYVEVRDWAVLLYFLYREYQHDPGYELSIYYNDTSVTLERENGYTLTFDFANDKLIFEDYDAFTHNSDDTTLIDLVAENGRDENGAEQLIQRDTKSSFDRYGESLTVDLGSNGIHMLMADGKYYIPLQTLNDFTLLPLQISIVYNGKALFLASDNIFFDYGARTYTDVKDSVADRKLYCLISPVSFSCGNLVPAALKSSQKVTLLGRTSGGGSCIVQPMTTAYGTLFQVSGYQRMSFLKNGSFYDIDQGVEPDYYIDDIAYFYDRQALTKYINNLF